ncbi:MAG: LapA family protein [Planctomycetota bacterium]|jgi:uncharacterized integral membrane protein
MNKFKLIVAGVILLLVVIVLLQNTEAVETKLLFLTITMPRVLLLLVTFILGFVGGLIAASHVLTEAGKSEAPGQNRSSQRA